MWQLGAVERKAVNRLLTGCRSLFTRKVYSGVYGARMATLHRRFFGSLRLHATYDVTEKRPPGKVSHGLRAVLMIFALLAPPQQGASGQPDPEPHGAGTNLSLIGINKVHRAHRHIVLVGNHRCLPSCCAVLAARDPDSPALAVGVMLFAFTPILCQPVPATWNR